MFHESRSPAVRSERWSGIAKLLVDYLENFKKQQEFLREIDRRIIASRGGECTELLQFVVDQTHSLLPVSRVSFYLIKGDNAELTVCSGSEDPPQRVISLEEFDNCFCRWEEGTGLWVSDDLPLCPLGFRGTAVLAVPARMESKTQQALGLLLVESSQDVRYTQLAEAEVCRFLSTVSGQAAVALKFHEQLAAEARLWNFANQFNEQPFDPRGSVNLVAEHFPKFLPQCESGCGEDSIYVQILFLERTGDEEVLAIRGSNDPDRNPGLTQVSIRDSVCGLLIREPERPYVLCDPTEDAEYRHLYKRYLGKEEGGSEDIRCELAIPLEHKDGGRFAVINLESKQVKAFKASSVAQYIEKAAQFTPILYAIKNRIETHALAQSSTLQVLESYLALIGTQYLHSLRTPYSSLSQGLVLLRETIPAEDKTSRSTLDDIQQAVSTIYRLQNSFASDINDFASPKKHDVMQLLEGAISLLNTLELKRTHGIEIETSLNGGVIVECSLFMKQIFYNIIQNAIIWLGKKREAQPGHRGVISISLKVAKDPESDEEVAMNRFCEIRIHDNGPGISEEYKSKILNNAFSLRGPEGTGFGLYVANQYVLSLGGNLEIDSVLGEYFTVIINLRRAGLQV